jgi:hypothetical protein
MSALRLLTRLIALVLLGAFLIAIPGSPAQAHLAGCELHANNPHPSSSGKGIVAKSSMNCDHPHDNGQINLTLYKCDRGRESKPDENWIFDNCTLVRWSFNHISPVSQNKTYVRQVPKPGEAEAHGSGYFVNDTVFCAGKAPENCTGRNSFVVFLNT